MGRVVRFVGQFHEDVLKDKPEVNPGSLLRYAEWRPESAQYSSRLSTELLLSRHYRKTAFLGQAWPEKSLR